MTLKERVLHIPNFVLIETLIVGDLTLAGCPSVKELHGISLLELSQVY
jgi:hypothetical protein